LQNVTIVVLFFTTALVLLGSLPFIDARHSDEGYSTGVTAGTNQLFYRDSTNMSPQTATLELFVNNQKVEIRVVEADSDLDPNSIDSVIVTITQNGLDQEVIAMETNIHTGIFTEMLTLGVGLFSATYAPEHQGVGRLSAELRDVNAGTLNIFDYSIDDPDGFNTRHTEACPVDLVTHPVDIQAEGDFVDGVGTINSAVFDPDSEITVTLSYANAILEKKEGGAYLPSELELFWRPSIEGAIGGFASFSDSPNSDTIILNEAEKTITGTLTNFVFQGTLSGQYALGVQGANPCTGGGGGNLVQPNELVIGIASIIGGAVGGELIPVDNVSLVLAYSLVNSWWMTPIGIGIGVGIYLVKRKL